MTITAAIAQPDPDPFPVKTTASALDPQQLAESLLGPIMWDDPAGGFCRCPGELLHTAPNRPRDCRVHIDGAPTIHCFHSHCTEAVAAANLELRRRLGAHPWTLVLPDGRTLKSGEPFLNIRDPLKPKPRDELCVLEAVKRKITEQRERIFENFYWPYEQIVQESPLQLSHREPIEQFRLWLRLWPGHSILWNGEVFHSGKPDYAGHFRPITDWYRIGPVMGNYTTACSFRQGAFSRANDAILARHFLVVESDTLSRDQVGAVFQYLRRRLHYQLHCIVDTGGKSLHGWFSPPLPEYEPRLKAALTALGCDPQLFSRSQPVRVPGAFRNGNVQRLIWIREL